MKAVTITGTAVKRSKKEALLSNSGTILGLFAFPSKIAIIAITELIPTNTTARKTDIAELYLNDSAKITKVHLAAKKITKITKWLLELLRENRFPC